MSNFSFYYIEANVVCVIVFGILLFHNHVNIDKQEKQIKFSRALFAFMLYFLIDCIWAAIVDGLLPKTRFSVVTVVFVLCILMSAITYTWLDYVMSYEQVPGREKPIHRFAVAFPFLVSTVALILNYIIAPQVLINEALDTLMGYSVYLVTVPVIYMIAILFYTIRKARREENPIEKRNHLFIGFFPLLSLIGGMVEVVFLPSAPIYCFTQSDIDAGFLHPIA